MNIASIALQGLLAADSQLQNAAIQLAAFGANTPDGANVDVVAFSTAAVALLSAKDQFAANEVVLKTADSIQANTLNVFA